MTNTIMLTKYIDESGYRKGHIASALGISSYGLMLKINNKSEFKASEIAKLCDLLKISKKDRDSIFFARTVD